MAQLSDSNSFSMICDLLLLLLNVQINQHMDPITIGLGVASLGGQLFGAIKGGQANSANEALLNQRKEENDAFFKSRINRDFLQTNAAKGILEKIRKQYENTGKTIDSKAEVTGATPEQVIAEKSANNENLNDAVSSIAQGATSYQENAENGLMNSKNALLGVEMGINSAKAQNASNLASNAGNLLGTAAMLNGFGDAGGGNGASSGMEALKKLGATKGADFGRTPLQTESMNKIAQSGLKGLKSTIITKNNRTPLV